MAGRADCAVAVALVILTGARVAGETFQIRAGNSRIPAGTEVHLSLGGTGCNCDPAAGISGTTDARGFSDVTLEHDCGGRVPDRRCRIFGTATVEVGGRTLLFRGSAGLTLTDTPGVYRSLVRLEP